MQIDQFVHTLAYGDAISGEALCIQSILREQGLKSDIYVVNTDPRFQTLTKSYKQFEPVEGAGILLHFSIASPLNEIYLEANKCRRAVLYHNLTPESWFAAYNARVTKDLKEAREQLGHIVGNSEVVLADSSFNLLELLPFGVRAGTKGGKVLPLVVDRAKWEIEENPGITQIMNGHGGVNFLTVGRVAPNKCIEDILKIFYFYHHKINKSSRLWIVGSDVDSEIYSFELKLLVDHLRLRNAVKLVGSVADSELKSFYKAADLYFCMSEHEGFCVPLIEAMYFGLPIIAYDSCAIKETLGDAGVLVREKKHAKLAELTNIVLSNKALLTTLSTARQKQLTRFSWNFFKEQLLRDLVEPMLGPMASVAAHA